MKLKSILTNSFGILFSRITGLFRDVLMASALGASIYSDMFFIAFKLPNLFRRIFAEGAFTQAFMPSFIASKNRGVFAVTIFLRFILFLIIVSIFVGFFPEIVTKLLAVGWSEETIEMASPLTAINFWYLDLVFIITFLATLLQYKEHFATTALSTALLNLSMITALWIYMQDSPKDIAIALSISVLIGGLLQILAHIYTIIKLKLHKILIGGWRYRKDRDIEVDKKRFTSSFIPAIWGNSTAQLNAFIDTLLASFLVSGSISYLFYANRVFQLPLALFAIATATALFPSISKSINSGRESEAYQHLDRAFWLLAFALGFATVGGVILSEPIVWLLFERGNFTQSSSIETVAVLKMYMVGLLPFGLAKLFSLFLYASHAQAKAAKVATYSLIVNITSSLILMQYMGVQGLALAGSIGGWVLFIFTVKEVGGDRFFRIVKGIKVIYFIISMTLFGIILSYINDILISMIR